MDGSQKAMDIAMTTCTMVYFWQHVFCFFCIIIYLRPYVIGILAKTMWQCNFHQWSTSSSNEGSILRAPLHRAQHQQISSQRYFHADENPWSCQPPEKTPWQRFAAMNKRRRKASCRPSLTPLTGLMISILLAGWALRKQNGTRIRKRMHRRLRPRLSRTTRISLIFYKLIQIGLSTTASENQTKERWALQQWRNLLRS